ncbi:hypothetical protein MLD38_022385 [Melastoma candidum]|uniref:Uncharacterized protein n=1 Tax=Melastoma candidum TaxID=119954 RepID=A0ACB9QMG0_9MYRT|nr:hypothetical protein MLD38_022385 [Melastoma candidum]
MLAPVDTLADPRRTPQPVVWGQFPSSQRPTIGRAMAVSSRISASSVNSLPQWCLTRAANHMAPSPSPAAQKRETMAAIRALAGRPAPSSFPTLVEAPRLRDEGKTYTREVVWMRMPMEATVAFGLLRRPQRIIISSYHHHSRQTETQVGTARASSEDHPRRQLWLGDTHESS